MDEDICPLNITVLSVARIFRLTEDEPPDDFMVVVMTPVSASLNRMPYPSAAHAIIAFLWFMVVPHGDQTIIVF